MRESFGQPSRAGQATGGASLDLDADWSYLRAHLDHPAHGPGNRLGSGLASWLLGWMQASAASAPRLSILSRIALGPRQSLALVEAEGVHLLVGISADGAPTFFSLGEGSGGASHWVSVSSDAPAAGIDAVPDSRALGRAAVRPPLTAKAGLRPAGRARMTGRVSWV